MGAPCGARGAARAAGAQPTASPGVPSLPAAERGALSYDERLSYDDTTPSSDETSRSASLICPLCTALTTLQTQLTDPRGQITSYVFDVVRSYIPRIDLDDVFTTKEDIAQAVKDELGKAMSSYGYQILQTLVTDIEPASNVKAAMNDINAAHRQRVAALERAEAEKLQIVKAAEADAEAKHLAGQGIARQRQAIVNGLRESVNTFQEDVTEVNAREVLNLVLTTQYFDTLNSIGSSSRTNTVFVPHGPGAVSDVAQQIAAGGIMAAATTQTMKRGR